MHYEFEVSGRRRQVVVVREGDRLAVTVDGRSRWVDAACIGAQTLSLIVGDVLPKGDSPRSQMAAHPARVYEVVVVPPAARKAHGKPGAPESLGASGVPGAPGVDEPITVRIGAASIPVAFGGRRRRIGGADAVAVRSQRVVAPMSGRIVRVLVKPGEAVRARQPLVVVEAMKMENELRAVGDATVVRIHVREGASIDAGAVLVELE